MVACLRCTRALDRIEAAGDLQFWRCPVCQRDYAEENGRLMDRWLSPISLVLYGIIFSRHPQTDAAQITDHFIAGHTRETLALIVDDIREELARPKQRVRDILPLACAEVGESDVREFLALVGDRIAAVLADA